MSLKNVEFRELESFLRNWSSLAGEQTYDFVGMFHLFRACLLNLAERSTEDDWEPLYDMLDAPERQFLMALVRRMQTDSSR